MTSLGVYADGVWQHQCGGSLVTNFHVLTASHCFQYDQEG
jgi:secreted trypsin-like serine protease